MMPLSFGLEALVQHAVRWHSADSKPSAWVWRGLGGSDLRFEIWGKPLIQQRRVDLRQGHRPPILTGPQAL